MATLIQINERIFNLDHIQEAELLADGKLYLTPASGGRFWCAEGETARQAWAWLQKACWATFPVVDEEAAE